MQKEMPLTLENQAHFQVAFRELLFPLRRNLALIVKQLRALLDVF